MLHKRACHNCHFAQDMRHQMLNDVKALCDAQTVPGLVSFCGAYHIPESGQVCIVQRRIIHSPFCQERDGGHGAKGRERAC